VKRKTYAAQPIAALLEQKEKEKKKERRAGD